MTNLSTQAHIDRRIRRMIAGGITIIAIAIILLYKQLSGEEAMHALICMLTAIFGALMLGSGFAFYCVRQMMGNQTASEAVVCGDRNDGVTVVDEHLVFRRHDAYTKPLALGGRSNITSS